MSRRTLLAAMILSLGAAAPAFAHEEINPSTFPSGKPVFFTLSAANEKNVDLTRLVVVAPQGALFGETTREPAGWSATRTENRIAWSGGAVKPEKFESWGFEIEGADQPGTLTYEVTLGFANGSTEDADVVVTATTAASTGAPTTTASTTATTGAPSSVAVRASDVDSVRTRANTALIVGIAAAVVALTALAVRRRRSAAPAREDW